MTDQDFQSHPYSQFLVISDKTQSQVQKITNKNIGYAHQMKRFRTNAVHKHYAFQKSSTKPIAVYESQRTRSSYDSDFCYPTQLNPGALIELMAAKRITTIHDLPFEVLTIVFSFFYETFAFYHDPTIFNIMRVCPRWFNVVFGIYWGCGDTRDWTVERRSQCIKSMIRAEKHPAIPAYARRMELVKKKENKDKLEVARPDRIHAGGYHHRTRTLRNAIALTNAAVYEAIMGYHTPSFTSGNRLYHMPAPFQKVRRYKKTSSARIASWRGNNAPRATDSDARYDFANPKMDNDLLLWEPGQGWLAPETETAKHSEIGIGRGSVLTGKGPTFRSWGTV